jgi:hypothetical protein
MHLNQPRIGEPWARFGPCSTSAGIAIFLVRQLSRKGTKDSRSEIGLECLPYPSRLPPVLRILFVMVQSPHLSLTLVFGSTRLREDADTCQGHRLRGDRTRRCICRCRSGRVEWPTWVHGRRSPRRGRPGITRARPRGDREFLVRLFVQQTDHRQFSPGRSAQICDFAFGITCLPPELSSQAACHLTYPHRHGTIAPP